MKCFTSLILLVLSMTLVACGTEISSPFVENIASRNWTEDQESPDERAYCNTSQSVAGPLRTVSGVAKFEYRDVSIEPGAEGLTEIVSEPKPIRHAQYEVINGSGDLIQCGETDENGAFSFNVTESDRVLSLKIYSRSFNNFNKASIFKAPETNELYSLDFNFVPNRDHTVSLTAQAEDSDLLGAAFFILDQIHLAQDRLKILTSASNGAVLITDIPKVDIYWEKGFDPGMYIGSQGPLSFFSRPHRKLFILGGRNGDVRYADTDHFDSSIILHEYFHFLESSISNTSSPGGPHNGNQILDPRLAWSEGTAQFFQAAILGKPSVLDTRGNPNGETGFLVKLGIEAGNNDIPSDIGEGDFREFCVARFLWDIHDDEDDTSDPEDAPEPGFDQIKDRFSDFWETFANIPVSNLGLNSQSTTFISTGLFLDALNSNLSSAVNTDVQWTDLLDHHKFTYPAANANSSFRDSYGLPLVETGATESLILQGPYFNPRARIEDNDPIFNMKFHSVSVRASGKVFSYNVEAPATGSSGDIFVYIYENSNEGIRFRGITEDNYLYKLSSPADSYNLPPGDYLVVSVVRQIPSSSSIITYNFPDFEIGGF